MMRRILLTSNYCDLPEMNEISIKCNNKLGFSYCVDTPGFANENLTKPEETKIISGGGGLAKPETIAKCILDDSLVRSPFDAVK